MSKTVTIKKEKIFLILKDSQNSVKGGGRFRSLSQC